MIGQIDAPSDRCSDLLFIIVPAEAQSARCRVLRADDRAITKGDTLRSVVARLGCRGERVGDVTHGRRRRVDYSWPGRGDFGANVTLTSANGVLVHRSELGPE